MKGKRISALIAALAVILIFEQCGEVDTIQPFDSNGKYVEDSTAMAEYISTQGYDPSLLDTINLAVYTVLETGDGEKLEYDDIVTFDFSVRTTDDSVQVTSVRQLAIDYGLFEIDTVTLVPFEIDTVFTGLDSNRKFTLAPSGWTVTNLFLASGLSPLNSTYKEIVAKTMIQMNVGGRATMVLPSAAFYGSSSDAYSTSVFIIDVYPTFVRKPNS
ncbi:MAG: hypothetical protein ABJ004_19290 [Cyclobacteriaceae bacterium]